MSEKKSSHLQNKAVDTVSASTPNTKLEMIYQTRSP